MSAFQTCTLTKSATEQTHETHLLKKTDRANTVQRPT